MINFQSKTPSNLGSKPLLRDPLLVGLDIVKWKPARPLISARSSADVPFVICKQQYPQPKGRQGPTAERTK